MFDSFLDRTIVASFDRTGFARHARHFSDGPWRALDDSRVLITGGTAGIGLAAARDLSERGAHCLLWGRRVDPGERAADEVGGTFSSVDLGDLEAVRRAAWALQGPLSGIILNAGAMPLERRQTPQGHELMWASQVLGHLLILRILEQRGLLTPESRVVWVASGGMYLQPLELSDLTREADYRRHIVYANAKRAQVMLSASLAESWPSVPMASMHPGWVDTEAVAVSMPIFARLTRPILRTPAQGADTAVWCIATDPSPPSGTFWFDRSPAPEHLLDKTRSSSSEALVKRVFADTDGFLAAP